MTCIACSTLCSKSRLFYSFFLGGWGGGGGWGLQY